MIESVPANFSLTLTRVGDVKEALDGLILVFSLYRSNQVHDVVSKSYLKSLWKRIQHLAAAEQPERLPRILNQLPQRFLIETSQFS